MSLLDTLRSAVKIADDVTKPLQANVSYQRVTARDQYGDPSAFGSVIQLRAIVDHKKVPVRTLEGVTTMSRAVIELLDINAVMSATGGNGVSDGDLFTLPDGSKGKVLDVGGFVDAGTRHPIATTVMLG